MLVLSRTLDESIVIADGLITITVVSIQGDKVRLGIEAPRDIPVHRAEVQARIAQPQSTNHGEEKDHQQTSTKKHSSNARVLR